MRPLTQEQPMSRNARFTITTSFTLPLAEAERLKAKFEADWRNAIASVDLNNPDNPATIVWELRELKR